MTASQTAIAATREKPEEKESAYFVRFNIRQRIEHIALITTFTLLSVTGLIQLFYKYSLATWTVLALGGIEQTRLIHRVIGVIFTLGIVYHFIYLAYKFFIQHAKPTIMPNLQDFRNVVLELRSALGMKAPEPRFDRYDYKQKFEYIGMMFGSIVLIATGLILMFPALLTNILPGEVVAAAARFHGYEASLAVITILVWHLYSVVLRPGTFPADTSIFTGKISRKRMIEEHYLEYLELTGKQAAEADRKD